MVGAFLFYELREDGMATPLAMLFGVGLSVLIAVAMHLVVMRRLRRSSAIVRLVATLGLFSLLVAVGVQRWGTGAERAESILPTTPRYPFGGDIAISEDRLWLILIAILVTAVLSLVYRYTQFGRATEAVAENPVAAGAVGLSPDVIASVNWALGAVLAAITAILIAPILFLSVAALSFTVLRSLAAALFGGFRSFWLTLLGAFGIGVLESELLRYYPEEPGLSRSAAFLMIVAVLVVSGRALPLRRELLERLPRLGSGKVHVPSLVGAAVAMTALLLWVPDGWATALIVTMCFAVVCLSVVVVTGFVGQLSLAQFAFAGFGALVAGRFVVNNDAPFIVGLIVGVLAAVPLGLLVAIPALRTRGVNLAVITFGLATMVYELLLNTSTFTGGLLGTHIGEPDLFGLDINGVDHPGRYGVVVLAFLIGASVLVANLRRGRAGRRLVAVRSNERAAAAVGISVYGAKLYAFGLAAAIAALGGILLSFRQEAIAYGNFTPFMSIQVVVFAVIGGIGFVLGPLFGSTLAVGGVGTYFIGEFDIPSTWLEIAGGVILLFMLLRHPDGLADDAAKMGALRDRLLRRTVPVPVPEPVGPEPVAAEPAAIPTAVPLSLAVEHLSVRFGGVVALSDVSLSVQPGEIVGLIGPNGAGKTTLIDAVTGFVRPSSGRIRLGDQPVERWSARRRSRAGLARSFQSLELFDDMTVRENIQTACDSRSPWLYLSDLVHPGRQELSEIAGAVARELELDEELDRSPDELAYGRRRLVAIARAVATQPSLLLLDEPAAGLSESETRELGDVIVRLAKEWGLGVLLVEHDVGLVMRVSDRVVVLDFGVMIAEGTPGEVQASPAVRAAYLGEPTGVMPPSGNGRGAATNPRPAEVEA
jgi:sulfate-transporting ATPase